jgi:hypothetical protein
VNIDKAQQVANRVYDRVQREQVRPAAARGEGFNDAELAHAHTMRALTFWEAAVNSHPASSAYQRAAQTIAQL